MIILTLIDPLTFTAPLARPNPRIVGNVGERTLQFFRTYFNSRDTTVELGTMTVSFGPIQKGFPDTTNPRILESGDRWTDGLPIIIALDTETSQLPDGLYTLEVSSVNYSTELQVRVDKTDLYLISPWPDVSIEEQLAIQKADLSREIFQLDNQITARLVERDILLNQIKRIDAYFGNTK